MRRSAEVERIQNIYMPTGKQHSLPFERRRPGTALKFVTMLLWLALYCNLITQPVMAGQQAPNRQMKANQSPEAGGIVLSVDRNGHFTGTVLINDYSMPFLIDTGATYTSIPSKLAVAAGLPFGRQVETSTASGRSFDKLTKVRSMKIGTAEIKNIDAMVNSHLTEVLIGMNTLKYFHMHQSANKMTLVINTAMQGSADQENAVTVEKMPDAYENAKPKPVVDNTPSRPIKMSVVCDEKKHCITQFHND